MPQGEDNVFEPGVYRFRVAPNCGGAYDDAVEILERLGIPEGDFDLATGRIHSVVERGRLIEGAVLADDRIELYRYPVFGVQVYFRVYRKAKLVRIERIDDAEAAGKWLAAASDPRPGPR